jgi:hypothetical protein
VEKESLANALGAGATGKGVTGATRAGAGALKELEKRQKSRGTRTSRDALDRALVDLAAFYRDVLQVQLGTRTALVHADLRDQAATIARATTPSRRCAASTRCSPAARRWTPTSRRCWPSRPWRSPCAPADGRARRAVPRGDQYGSWSTAAACPSY